MGIDKLGLSLFDILGYLLPGYLVLINISIFEGTFVKSSYFCLDHYSSNLFLFSIFAYFLGILCHSLISIFLDKFNSITRELSLNTDTVDNQKHTQTKTWLIGKIQKIFRNPSSMHVSKLNGLVTRRLNKIYQLPKSTKLNNLEKYLLTDSFLVSVGLTEERNSLTIREGFFKTSTSALFIFVLTTFFCVLRGGLSIQIDASNFLIFSSTNTFFLLIIEIIVLIVFNKRRKFFHRMKVDNTSLIFLSYCAQKDLNK